MWLYLALSPVVALIAVKIYQKWTCGMCKCDNQMYNKVIIVTGSNTGIGFETAKELARRGARVILACRDVDRGLKAENDIVRITGNKNVLFKQLDLASFESVRSFAEGIIQSEPVIHVLINNAGTGKLDNSLKEDGLPIEAQVNHFSPFLLTKLLLPLLKASAPSRIINVSSILHKIGKVDPDHFHKPAKTSLQHMRVYSNTKLANVLFTIKLSRILKNHGVTVNSLHPGAVKTDIFRHKPRIVRFLIGLLMKTPYEGAQTSIHLAVAPEFDNVTGKYLEDCRETAPSKAALDEDLADRLWKLSEQVITKERKEKL